MDRLTEYPQELLLTRRNGDSIETWIQRVRESNHCYINPCITPRHFPETSDCPWQAHMEFFPFNPKEGSPSYHLSNRKLLPPTYEQALCFTATCPTDPRSILFFHEPVYVPHLMHWAGLVISVLKSGANRFICLPPADLDWPNGLWLAGIIQIE